MAEWKTDTEEVKQIVKKCRDFKGSLQEEKCAQFIKNLDGYAQEILLEHRKIEHQLQDAIEGLRKAKRNVELLQQALEIYSTQAKASRELVEGAWEVVKKILGFYTHKHQEFIKRLNYASEAIDNEYNIAPPEILSEGDFESPTIVYHPKKSVFDERLKDLREDFSFSLYADLKDKISAFSHRDRATNSKEHGLDLMSGVHSFDESFLLAKKHCVKNCKKALQDFTGKIKESPNDLNAMNEAFNNLETELERVTENLSQKTAPILERYENYKQKALEYREFLEKEKEGFIVDDKKPLSGRSPL